MKITIELSPYQVQGIKNYLKETEGIKAKKQDIEIEVKDIVSGYLQSPNCAISDYIKQVELSN